MDTIHPADRIGAWILSKKCSKPCWIGPHQDGSVCTTGLAVLRPTKIDALTLAYLLKTEFVITQLMRNNVGIAYPAIDESCLLGVLLPGRREDLPKLRRQAVEISENEERLHTIRKRFKESIENAGAAWRQMNLTPASKPHPATCFPRLSLRRLRFDVLRTG